MILFLYASVMCAMAGLIIWALKPRLWCELLATTAIGAVGSFGVFAFMYLDAIARAN